MLTCPNSRDSLFPWLIMRARESQRVREGEGEVYRVQSEMSLFSPV